MSQYLVKYVMVASSTCGVTYIEYQSCLTNTEIYISVALHCFLVVVMDSRNLLIYAMIMKSNGILNLTPEKSGCNFWW